ncbi:hypothetical protein [Alkalitalea saponilacus]|uniref:DUF3575 domain-containing protein n=1 Tax=Alkalitalea saponilacus TaxID=889453 RepID=A0A1T5HU75_9BACT|nr:hypothetical protein [Alkalitalea saponilacus]ASB50734.1 hypothetical protein CDL62_17045 [Alkalitalea saponilacus]SKC24225.1 hypothetical protein SAMN03080601_03520 [Alkalitalea saponilacus]
MSNISLSVVLLFFLSTITLSAEEKEDAFVRKNKIGVEMGGSSLILSFKYERILLNYNRHKTAVEIGGGLFTFNAGINQLLSFHQHHVEIKLAAIGARLLYSDPYYYSFGAGYRFQRPSGRTSIQISCPVNYGISSGYFVIPGASISRVF